MLIDVRKIPTPASEHPSKNYACGMGSSVPYNYFMLNPDGIMYLNQRSCVGDIIRSMNVQVISQDPNHSRSQDMARLDVHNTERDRFEHLGYFRRHECWELSDTSTFSYK